jgi:hypothetical protein
MNFNIIQYVKCSENVHINPLRIPSKMSVVDIKTYFFFFCSLLADKRHFILISQPSSKSTLPFAGLQHINNARLISNQFLLQVFDPNEWCLKNGLLSGGLSPRPFSHESSALTTRPQLLALLRPFIN